LGSKRLQRLGFSDDSERSCSDVKACEGPLLRRLNKCPPSQIGLVLSHSRVYALQAFRVQIQEQGTFVVGVCFCEQGRAGHVFLATLFGVSSMGQSPLRLSPSSSPPFLLDTCNSLPLVLSTSLLHFSWQLQHGTSKQRPINTKPLSTHSHPSIHIHHAQINLSKSKGRRLYDTPPCFCYARPPPC